jgi:hypothetical protein
MVLELRLSVERLGWRRGDDWRGRRGRGTSGKTSEHDARDNDAQRLGHRFSWFWGGIVSKLVAGRPG